ncbi:MAG: DUF1501 domain-containing protein, partial [Planctomycetia bacterium]
MVDGVAGRSRREFLQVGGLSGLGLSLGGLFRAEAARADTKSFNTFAGTAQSVIHIWMPGGWAQQETFDPKPLSPMEYRGDMGTVATALPGVVFNEKLAHTAKIADRITVVRSMTHGEAAHERGTHNMFTGYRPSPALTFPSFGSVVSHELGPRDNLPPYVCFPNLPAPDAGAGYLGSAYGPFTLGSDPANPNFSVRDMALPGGVDGTRFTTRQKLRDIVGRHFQRMDDNPNLQAMDEFYKRAYDLVSSTRARAAFDISAEAASIRDEYGRNEAGQRMLLARRLVESGVRCVSIEHANWDTHDNNFKQLRGDLLPKLDAALATLFNDLED